MNVTRSHRRWWVTEFITTLVGGGTFTAVTLVVALAALDGPITPGVALAVGVLIGISPAAIAAFVLSLAQLLDERRRWTGVSR